MANLERAVQVSATQHEREQIMIALKEKLETKFTLNRPITSVRKNCNMSVPNDFMVFQKRTSVVGQFLQGSFKNHVTAKLTFFGFPLPIYHCFHVPLPHVTTQKVTNLPKRKL